MVGMSNRLFTVAALPLLVWAAWAPDAWQRIGPGGGGAQYIPTISPHDPNTVLIRCDMTGGYLSRDGGASWGMFNTGGGVRFFVYDPLDAKTMYTEALGLWRSVDSGQTWNLLYPAPGETAGCRDAVGSRGCADRDEGRPLSARGRAGHRSRGLEVTLRGNVRGQFDDSLGLGRRRQELEEERRSSGGRVAPVYRSVVASRGPDDHGADGKVGRRCAREAHGRSIRRRRSSSTFRRRFPTHGGKLRIYGVSRDSRAYLGRWRRDVADFGNPAGREAAALRDRDQRATSRCGVRGLQQSGRPELRRREDHRCGPQLDAGVEGNVRQPRRQCARCLDHRAIRPELGRNAAESRRRADRSEYRLRHRPRPDHAHHRRRQDLEQRLFAEADGDGFTTTGLDVTTAYGVHFDPFDRTAPCSSPTPISDCSAARMAAQSWISATEGVPRAWRNTTYWVEFDPAVEGRMWAVDERHARSAAAEDVAAARRRELSAAAWRSATTADGPGASATRGMPQTAATHILLDPTSPKAARALYVTGSAAASSSPSTAARRWPLKNNGIAGTEPFAWRLARDSRRHALPGGGAAQRGRQLSAMPATARSIARRMARSTGRS